MHTHRTIPIVYQYLLLKISKIIKKSAHYLLIVTEIKTLVIYIPNHLKRNHRLIYELVHQMQFNN